ncbi:flagellar hook-associated protein FlgK [Virgibacillus byunsanensis]|uniref:Flagellar hook-associated protein 1 n=1 Tax=Virgibacillus byunsanensis TaxID=570945 RepID=A0ABW3LN43_9BACI
MSTFHGLEMAKQALFTQQSALYTTGHNISNANTEGYTRQRVNFESLSPYPTASRNRPEIPGQMGTGVEAGTVERVRDKFLDMQFRAENSKSGYWEALSASTDRMERLLNEPSESGLSKSMDQLWQSLQDLSVNPENSGARSVVVQRGVALAESFNYTSDSLESIRSDLKNETDVTVKNANSLLEQISGINNQIKQIEPHGYLANDLYDERDRLVDELSGIVNINVNYSKSGGNAPEIADGLATIKLADKNGKPTDTLLEGNADEGVFNQLSINYSDVDGERSAVTGIGVGDDKVVSVEEFISNGSLKGNIEAYGYTSEDNAGNSTVKGLYTDMLSNIDDMVVEFSNAFNGVHSGGEDLQGQTGQDFFVNGDSEGAPITASTIAVNAAIQDDPDLVAASDEDGASGNGNNAIELAGVFDADLQGLGDNTTVRSYYESLIGDLGVVAQEANRMTSNTGILRSQVEEQRQSVSSVSLDEEMSNMIKFQHAYSAAARNMTAVDELIDRVINNMGLVGR